MTAHTSGLAILVVEDDAIIAWDIAMQLRALGYQTLGPASTGALAIELAGRMRPALVLMDIHLKGPMDGITAALPIGAAVLGVGALIALLVPALDRSKAADGLPERSAGQGAAVALC